MPTYTLRINGKAHDVEAEPDDTLLSVLRDDLDMTGSRYGCGEGQCGSCTVLVDNRAMRSCVAKVSAVTKAQIVTIEGLATGDTLHPVQQAFLEVEAFQCGYCTSGMVMATVALLRTNPSPTEADIVKALDRNVCRCGTYPRIVKAVKLAAERLRGATPATAQEARR
ncbi:(2Fe-2S)-binding protein [Luteitalea sp. TBR-22]|uniref:(2Fe-2S)-binding protein n=1 Tax=Luteitalea sp. TBR-22 TaxID=2802971 RepID=UPI001AFAE859|nr:(2Fe-2S)-binding protein [Luteitalea sp. TBR-22]BCS32278.1 (2Fe-2S)-binding protein [Luteitalea sp. TBR-22]